MDRAKRGVAAEPRKFGRYQVLAQVGDGAMGRVYRAFDPMAGRVVAIKTLRSELLTGETRTEYNRRFEREARVSGRLSHPHIVTIFDVGDGYFVMEFLEGVTLRRLLAQKGALALEEALRLLRPLADALDFAHDHGVIHRDIKPSNVMILADGRPKLMDFGIARIEWAGTTSRGRAIGSPLYMAPEQILGAKVDARSDVFAFAVVAYEMLTGVQPFRGDNIAAIIHRTLNENSPAPSSRRPELAGHGDAAFARALAKDPARRPSKAVAFVDALAGNPLPAEEPAPAVPAGQAPAAAPESSPAPASLGTADLGPDRARALLAAAGRAPRLGGALALMLLLAAAWLLFLRSPPLVEFRVETDPPGAAVLLNGVPAGTSPVSLTGLPRAVHSLRVARNGYSPSQMSLDLTAGPPPAPIRLVLQALSARLRVRSEPPGAAVTADNQPAGTSPVEDLSLPPGPHRVRVESKGFETWERTLELKAGDDLTVDAVLVRQPPSASFKRLWVKEGDLVDLGPDVTPPRMLSGKPPEYPEEARKQQLGGLVVLDMIVNEQGVPTDLRVVTSAGPLLDQAVLAAVRTWRYEPALKNGVKVAVHLLARHQFDPEP